MCGCMHVCTIVHVYGYLCWMSWTAWYFSCVSSFAISLTACNLASCVEVNRQTGSFFKFLVALSISQAHIAWMYSPQRRLRLRWLRAAWGQRPRLSCPAALPTRSIPGSYPAAMSPASQPSVLTFPPVSPAFPACISHAQKTHTHHTMTTAFCIPNFHVHIYDIYSNMYRKRTNFCGHNIHELNFRGDKFLWVRVAHHNCCC